MQPISIHAMLADSSQMITCRINLACRCISLGNMRNCQMSNNIFKKKKYGSNCVTAISFLKINAMRLSWVSTNCGESDGF